MNIVCGKKIRMSQVEIISVGDVSVHQRINVPLIIWPTHGECRCDALLDR